MDKFDFWVIFAFVLAFIIGIKIDGRERPNEIYLTRHNVDGITVESSIRFGRHAICSIDAVENRWFLIPDGIYELQNTMSPKFRVKLPLVCNVPGRAGIRIHTGQYAQASKGCILVTPDDLEDIINLIEHNKTQGRKTYLFINNKI